MSAALGKKVKEKKASGSDVLQQCSSPPAPLTPTGHTCFYLLTTSHAEQCWRTPILQLLLWYDCESYLGKAITAGTFWPEQHTDETELQRVTAFLTSCTRSKLFNKKSQHVPVKSCRDAFWTHLPNSLIGCYFTSPRWGLPSLTIHALDFFLFRYFSVDTICEQWEQDRRTDTH